MIEALSSGDRLDCVLDLLIDPRLDSSLTDWSLCFQREDEEKCYQKEETTPETI